MSANRGNSAKKMMQWIILGILSIIAGVYIAHNQDKFTAIKTLRFSEFAVLLALTFASFLFVSYQFKILMLFFDIRLRLLEWFGLTICNNMYNYFLPVRGGIWLRGYYLKKQYGFRLSHYLPLVLMSYILMCFSSGLLGMACVALNNLLTGNNNWDLFFLFLLLLVCTFVAWWIFLILGRSDFSTRFDRMNRIIRTIQEGAGHINAKPKITGAFLLVNSGFIIFNGLGYGYCLHVIGAGEVNYLAAIGVMALTAFSMPFSLTPGNLGISEMIMGLSCYYLGASFDLAFLAACILRAISMMFVFLLGVIFSKILMGTISINELSEEPPDAQETTAA